MIGRRLVGQVGLAAALALGHRCRRTPSPVGRVRGALAVLAAGSSPLAASAIARAHGARLRPPSPAGVGLLVVYATSAAACEELLWRAPLLVVPPGPARCSVAALAGAGFVGLHLRRDGRAALPVHALNTAAWTAATLLGRRLRWPVLAHAAYDLLALTLRTTEPYP